MEASDLLLIGAAPAGAAPVPVLIQDISRAVL